MQMHYTRYKGLPRSCKNADVLCQTVFTLQEVKSMIQSSKLKNFELNKSEALRRV